MVLNFIAPNEDLLFKYAYEWMTLKSTTIYKIILKLHDCEFKKIKLFQLIVSTKVQIYSNCLKTNFLLKRIYIKFIFFIKHILAFKIQNE